MANGKRIATARRNTRARARSTFRFQSFFAAVGSIVADPMLLLTTFHHAFVVLSYYTQKAASTKGDDYLIKFVKWIKTTLASTPFSAIATQVCDYIIANESKFIGASLVSLAVLLTRRGRKWDALVVATIILCIAPDLGENVYAGAAVFIGFYHLADNNASRALVLVVALAVAASSWGSSELLSLFGSSTTKKSGRGN